MFASATTFSLLALPLLAAASPLRRDGGCSTGSVQCCKSTHSTQDAGVAALLGLLGVAVQDLTALVGFECSPISVIGAGGGACSANAVCCENNNVGGLISVGCLPIIL